MAEMGRISFLSGSRETPCQSYGQSTLVTDAPLKIIHFLSSWPGFSTFKEENRTFLCGFFNILVTFRKKNALSLSFKLAGVEHSLRRMILHFTMTKAICENHDKSHHHVWNHLTWLRWIFCMYYVCDLWVVFL